MSDIHVIHAQDDVDRIAPLIEMLRLRKWSVSWSDPLSKDVGWTEYREAVNSAKCLIVVWTRASVESSWVQDEAREGYKRRNLLPIALDEVSIPTEFSTLETTQLSDWQPGMTHPGVDQLGRRLSGMH